MTKAQGNAARPGLYYCAACNGQFTVTVGTVMERSQIPLNKWRLAIHLMGSSKKGVGAINFSACSAYLQVDLVPVPSHSRSDGKSARGLAPSARRRRHGR